MDKSIASAKIIAKHFFFTVKALPYRFFASVAVDARPRANGPSSFSCFAKASIAAPFHLQYGLPARKVTAFAKIFCPQKNGPDGHWPSGKRWTRG